MFRHDYDFIRGNVSEGCAGQDNTMQGKWQSYELQTFTFYFLITLFSNQDREKKNCTSRYEGAYYSFPFYLCDNNDSCLFTWLWEESSLDYLMSHNLELAQSFSYFWQFMAAA